MSAATPANIFLATGRRKTSTARVFLRPGTGAVTINHKAFDAFFPTEALRTQIKKPLVLTETVEKFDILATVAGGGVSGQAGAVRLGISRALVEYNLELRKKLKEEGLLTRDARAKEDQKIYSQHSGYEGGLREERARLVRQRKPQKLVEDAVHGMLPKTKMGEAMYRKLKVYAGPDHPHAAQKPSKLEVA